MDDLTLSTASAVPEPSSAMLALTGLGIMGLAAVRIAVVDASRPADPIARLLPRHDAPHARR